MDHITSTRLGALSDWKACLTPLRVDVVGDFAGNELFAIHGEALLSHCVTDAKVDFQDGFQLLHAVHAVETFLSRLKERGCNFHVLWLDSYMGLAVPHQVPVKHRHKYLLARDVLIKHLQAPGVDRSTSDDLAQSSDTDTQMSFVFRAIASDEFVEYTKTKRIHFIMCSHDEPRDLSVDVETGSDNIDHLAAMYLFANQGYRLASINDIEFRSSKVYTRILTPSSSPVDIRVLEPKAHHNTDRGCSRLLSQLDECRNGTEMGVRERVALVACASILAEKPDAATEKRVIAFLTHVKFLEHVELSQRACTKLDKKALDDDNEFLEDFSTRAIALIRHLVHTGRGSRGDWRVCDLIDGRLFLHTLQNLERINAIFYIENYGKILEALVGVDILHCLPSPSALPEDLSQKKSTHFHLSCKNHPQSQAKPSVLPFSHPVLDPYLRDIKLETEPSQGIPADDSKIFQELTHWHNAKRTLDPKKRPRPVEPWVLRRNQRFMADTIAYSASLTNASGKNISPEPIVEQKTHKGHLEKHHTGGGREKALKTSEAAKVVKYESRKSAIIRFFAQQCQDLEKVKPLVKRYSRANKYLLGLHKDDRETIGGELSLYICNILAQMLNESSSDYMAKSITALIRAHAADMYTLPLTQETKQSMTQIGAILQLPLHPNNRSTFTKIQRPLPFQVATIIQTKGLKIFIDEDIREFQLEHFGPYMERSFDSAPDPRVPFQPDAWQRKVLDAIDEEKSLFVVAPTSAGKTFISFYAMKKVLQANNDDVLVYVAPTKALVNQIAAEIQARFDKSYDKKGRSVWAIHTRDYRINNPTGCQVLVTVPHILQIMLLAPSNAQSGHSWSRRVKRIIFDEVHCIGQAEDGIIWEQLLLLAPCPIIALSATVGNPGEFKDWLAGTQKAKGFDLEMIIHSTRYSDLRKFVYQPPTKWEFDGLELIERLPTPGLDVNSPEGDRFVFVHPVGSIASNGNETLNDISLEPRDCLHLWKALSDCADNNCPIDSNLDPKRAFPEIIKKSDVILWEAALKDQLRKWMAETGSPFCDVHSHLKTNSKPCTGQKRTVDSTFPLLVDLRSRGALPAIIFNYDRAGCEAILVKLQETLRKAEKTYRTSDPEWKRRLSNYNEWQNAQKIKKRAKAPKETGTRRKIETDGTSFDKMDHIREDASQEASKWASFNPAAPIDRFSFADPHKISREELESLIENLMKSDKIDKPIIDALRRGMGVHHAGMNRRYRQVVEMLFRKGFLTVVIATGTLALGLNMPCKTVVFAGDSVFLTALNYRQASGRAGRRGFDLLGNVVFHGIPHHRVMDIMSSRLPDLRGQFPMSVTLILRLFGLLHGTRESDYAVKAVKSLLTQTRLYLGGPSSEMTIKHHLRFSIEYLQRQYLISSNGMPLNFSGLVGHLYYTENAVFAFHSLLKKGYLHKLCKNVNNVAKRKDMLLELVTVLCHLFCRIPCPRYMTKKWLKDNIGRSPSIILLPGLPNEAESILRGHNEETLSIFQAYVRTFVEQHLTSTSDDMLPFTKCRIRPIQNEAIDLSAANIPTLPATVIRSPFSALSGFTDDFSTIHELCQTVRAGVFLEEESIPYIPIYPDETNNVPFNAYILDFFKHGDMEALVRDNGIKKGDVWSHLKGFSLILATIVASLANFLVAEDAELDDAAIIDVQGIGDILEEEHDSDKDDEAVELLSKISAAVPQIQSKPAKKRGKKEVPDSWDDADDSDDSEEEGEGEEAKMPHTNGKAGDSSGATASWNEDDGSGLVKVYTAFKLLQKEFNEKFLKVWA
ncbi:DEAD/DEAH box helicase [Colletotrichum truncatum]|uniref:DEAD/DEAH box helicase n=1 Tax=Colletotrichum truncatum TaxID=5467 RepID=A0ACC3Z8T0_COLTU|nr:DEAD/DEAH box helicase [Colletotrichum truncatum]KAF6789271.1 DEAD/DEAH box helicase [Colletotrichum truncatum]